MRKIYNILVFPGGTEVGMEIYRSLVNCKEVKLSSVASKVVNHSDYIYKNHFTIKDINTSGWLEELNKIIINEKIDFIYPAHAFVIDALSKNRSVIKAEILLNEDSVLDITRSKRKTYNLFKDAIPVPVEYRDISEVNELPVFAKPDNCYGSQGAIKIDNKELLKNVFDNKNGFIVNEYLDGEEYTIDCFSNSNHELVFCEGRTRQRIRMGTSMHSEHVAKELDKYFLDIANTIMSRLKIIGPWFFQMKADKNGKMKLLEIEARIAGTMAFHRVKGFNFPLLHLYTFLGYDINLLTNNFDYSIDRALTNRYKHSLEYDTVYIDLDDTIIIHNRYNLDVIKFLYQCRNKNIKVILLSKSLAENKEAYLKEWRIDTLFDEIIWLNENESKMDHIDKSRKAIFIDDSFSQRADVAQKLNIPTFDPSMVEILMDERF